MAKKKIGLIAITILILVISIRSLYIDYTIAHRQPAYYITYEIQPGDCIDKVADIYRPPYMSVETLRSKIQVLNNVQTMIYPGTLLRVPIYK